MFGLQSYIVNGVRSKTSKNRIALYQPLTLLSLVVYHRENANIERIKEIQCIHPYVSLTADIKKSTVGLFINEILNKTVKEESHTGDLFEFIFTSLIAFDSLTTGYENFHLMFLIRLSRFLGFGAQHINELLGPRVTDEITESILALLLKAEYTTHIVISNEQRRVVLDLILQFYTDHIETIGEIKSIQILKEVMN
jgi:DNA repair protein RecO (recombination protein O)